MANRMGTLAFVGCLVACGTVSAMPAARTLTFEERVGYHRRLEELAHRHRLAAAPGTRVVPLDAVLPPEALREKVRRSLALSAALGQYWQRPLTGAQLAAEVDRMARSTKQPDRLREMFAALDDDPLLIAECLARPAIAERQVREWYALDRRFHGAVHERAERALAGKPADAKLATLGGEYREQTWIRSDGRALGGEREAGTPLDSAAFEARVDALRMRFAVPDPGQPLPVGVRSSLTETPSEFSVVMVLEHSVDRLHVASVRWAKATFDSWWKTASASLGEVSTAALPVPAGGYSSPEITTSACALDSWRATRLEAPDPRSDHTAVWTGTEMIVWGGANVYGLNSGGRYDPATDTWTPTDEGADVPAGRWDHRAAWTGTEMIVWGGNDSAGLLNTGGRYNPSTDAWTRMSAGASAPEGRVSHTAVWTGVEMLVWGGGGSGGEYLETGGRYNPLTDSWTPISTGAGVPEGRMGHSAVWTGVEMVVWGGRGGAGYLNTGGRYNPLTDSWTAMSTGAGVPEGRRQHSAVWTGSSMIVWGGELQTGPSNTGGLYDPAEDAWTPTSTGTNAPDARVVHTAVWSGAEMIVWGGTVGGGVQLNTGGRYDAGTDTWVPTSNDPNVPSARASHTAVWTGSEMIVWGGNGLATGGRYDPIADTWVATSTGSTVPVARQFHTAVWTGAEMVMWGGGDGVQVFDSGGRYVPATNTWSATSEGSGVPTGREWHTAVWTGTEMIVWGGWDGSTRSNTGGRYSPATDAWMPTSTGSDAPAARSGHTALWTGTEMIVWGGSDGRRSLNTGGRYNAASDEWIATSVGSETPSARGSHTAVWTGTEMIVWGGTNRSDGMNTGGRYDPMADAWTPTNADLDVPAARLGHSAVWTGTEMIVWGGRDTNQPHRTVYNTGGRYDPTTDSWVPTSTGADVPDAREHQTAVWTSKAMVVWGGGTTGGQRFGTGARYDPASNTWQATDAGPNAPMARQAHTAVWTGTEMIVWGGDPLTATGGLYCADDCTPKTWYRDSDSDGFGNPTVTNVACLAPPGFVTAAGDCDDATPSVNPGAGEACNGIDDDCDSEIDEYLTSIFYVDADGDRYGTAASSIEACARPDGYTTNTLDCDDTDAAVKWAGRERCDGKRNDCSAAAWPAVLDADGDGTEDACESCVDGDGDGWGDPGVTGNSCATDNCPTTANPGQTNDDFDGKGNACDTCPSDPMNDRDLDGVCGELDNCPTIANAGQADADGDGFGDACDRCPANPSDENDDLDRDGVGDACDGDVDDDGLPNDLDTDDDGDAVPDDDGDGQFDPCPNLVDVGCDDNCPFDRNPFQRDRDGDGAGDACDPTDDLVQSGLVLRLSGGASLTGATDSYLFDWNPESGAIGYDVYSGAIDELGLGSYGACYRDRIVTAYTSLDETPTPGSGRFYLVAPLFLDRAGSIGDRSDQSPRTMPPSCP